MILITLMTI